MSAILGDLAAGRIDASEAARRIDALKAAPAEDRRSPRPPRPRRARHLRRHRRAATTPRPTRGPRRPTGRSTRRSPARAWGRPAPGRPAPVTSPTAAAPRGASEPRGKAANGVERISVRAVGRRVRIVGETSVATLSADGPHVLRRNGTTLEVSSDGEIGPSLDGFSILRGVPRSLEDVRALGLGKELLLRVNPALAVDVEVTAGQLSTERVPHLGKIRVTAGGAKLLDVTEVNDVLVQAGSATIKGTITQGRHRVRAESGSLSITLGDDSNVTVKSDAQLGRVSWAGGHSGAGDEVVMGNGNARLDVEVVMGHAQVRVGSDAASSSTSGS